MAQSKNVTCRFYNRTENYCEKNGEIANCQNCKFNSANQSHQKPRKRSVEPDEIWNKKKAKDKEKQLRQKMIEDLENEDGWL